LRKRPKSELDSWKGIWGLKILKATYGTGDCVVDVTERVQAMVREGRLSLVVSNGFFTDPCPGKVKSLHFIYELPGSSQIYFHEVEEHNIVSIQAPSTEPAMPRHPLAVITPCSRPENLPALKNSIDAGRSSFEITWYVVFDELQVPPSIQSELEFGDSVFSVGEAHSHVGNAQRNLALDNIADGWVYFLDDDNLLHPELLPFMRAFIETHSLARAFVFPQIGNQASSHTAEARPEHMRPDSVDIAQTFWNRRTIGDVRFKPVHAYNADGLFIERVRTLHPGLEGFVFVNQPLCYYNALHREQIDSGE
jgi:hypothetical protein